MNTSFKFRKKSAPEPVVAQLDLPEEPEEFTGPDVADGESGEASAEEAGVPVGGTARLRSRARRRTARKAATTAAVPVVREPNPRLRWAAFNATAAAAGHVAIWSVTGDPMAGADYMARMSGSVPQLAAAAITAGAAVAGWKGAGLVQLHRLPGIYGLGARPGAALGAALWGQGTAPLVRDAMAAIEPWGTLLAPLLAAGPVAAACWWGLDRNTAHAAPPIRWIARIPLATVTVSSLLYAPGVLL
ncbi:hypothetical protein [Streptomyces sp. NPDC058394]|uniref:hypothetical protein n=1 Tax=Streptomyces sp. NPDC058394 TaxID=3346477 RepID=UPI003651584A